MRRRLVLAMLILPALCAAQYDRPGSSDAQFLKIGVSPRGSALSDAYIAAVNGAEACYYNASALPWLKGTDIVFNHTRWFAGINHEFFAAAQNFGDYGTAGISVTALVTDLMDVRTPLQPEGTGETFYVGNYRFGLSYARFLTDRVTLGATVSYIHMALFREFKADAFSVDISTQYVTDWRGFRFGMQISNFGSNIQYVNEPYPLPTAFTFGMSMNAIDADIQKVLVSFAAVKPNEGAPQGQLGAEWNYDNMVFLRVGYKVDNPVARYSFGGGLAAAISGYRFRFDYSYNDYRLLGAAHRVGLGLEF